MKKNKYIIFATIGFELIALLILALWIGNQLKEHGYGTTGQAILVLIAFLVWFISLMVKLKKIQKND